MATRYQVVFDVASADTSVWPVVGGIGFALLVGIVLFDLYRLRTAQPSRLMPARSSDSLSLLTLIALLMAVLVFSFLYVTSNQQRTLVAAERSGAATLVEGVVSHFVPWPHGPHKMERFCVASTCFEYSDHVINGGFNRTSAEGGPIREGLRVRVMHVGGVIVRLEIAAGD